MIEGRFTYFFTLFCCYILFFQTACRNTAPSSNQQSAALTQQNFSKVLFEADKRNGFRAEVNLNFPVVGAAGALRDSVQSWVTQFVSNALLNRVQSQPLEALVTQFFSRFDATYTQPDKEYDTSWLVETHDSVLLNATQALSLRLSGEASLGGAHNKLPCRFVNFDPLTGKTLDIFAAITDRDELRRLCEAQFAKLKDNNAFYPDDVLPMPQNIALTPQGLLCYYDASENATGEGITATEFVIPYAALDRILDKRLATWLPAYWLP
jgi:hypothetical protein